VFHSLRCDCRAQLELALESIAGEDRGILVYEHRKAEASVCSTSCAPMNSRIRAPTRSKPMSGSASKRTCGAINCPEKSTVFWAHRVRLLSNNPAKVEAVERAGVQVVERIPCLAAPLHSTDAYLRTKKTKMGHLLEET